MSRLWVQVPPVPPLHYEVKMFCVYKWSMTNYCQSFSTLSAAYEYLVQEGNGYPDMQWWITDSCDATIVASGKGSPFDYRRP